MASKSRIIYDVTSIVLGLGWSLEDPEAVRLKLKELLVEGKLPKAFDGHLRDREFMLSEPHLLVRVITLRQLQGGLRFLFQYSFTRECYGNSQPSV